MNELYAAVGLFLATHLLPAIQPLRTAIIARFGRPIYFSAFSGVSIAVTIWLFMSYLNAPYVEIWPYMPWARWFVLMVMPVACILVVTGLSSPNPFSLSLNSHPFDPAKPGITAAMRHPVIWGLGLWSAVHMVPNGDAASLTLFGLLTLLSATGPRTLERRRKAAMGEEAWHALNRTIVDLTLSKVMTEIGWIRILAGLALYVGLLVLHGPVIGVSPLDG